jgi:hypothetical protein
MKIDYDNPILICVDKILPLVPLAIVKSSVVRNSNPLILLE